MPRVAKTTAWGVELAASAPMWAEVAKGVAAIAQLLAIAVGGWWAYRKFRGGRYTWPKASVGIDGSVLRDEDRQALEVTVTFRNTGLFWIDLTQKRPLQCVRVWATDSMAAGANPYWGESPLILREVFETYRGCHVGETLKEHLLLPVADASAPDEWLAYRVELVMVNPRRRRKGKAPNPWHAEAIIPGGLRSDRDKPASLKGAA